MVDDGERSNRVAGSVYLQCQVVGFLALAAAVACAVVGREDHTLVTAAAVFMIASALAFGMLANAVLRR